MSESKRHTVRVTSTYREAAMWLVWRLCALPVWAMRATITVAGPYMSTVSGRASTMAATAATTAASTVSALARNVCDRAAEVRQQPSTTYVGVIAVVVGLAIFSGLIGH